MLLSLCLDPDSSALEDSFVAHRLAKGTVLPNDKEKFTKMGEEASLFSSSLVRKSYEVVSLHLVVLSHHFFL